jgi:hypothetical protein
MDNKPSTDTDRRLSNIRRRNSIEARDRLYTGRLALDAVIKECPHLFTEEFIEPYGPGCTARACGRETKICIVCGHLLSSAAPALFPPSEGTRVFEDRMAAWPEDFPLA